MYIYIFFLYITLYYIILYSIAVHCNALNCKRFFMCMICRTFQIKNLLSWPQMEARGQNLFCIRQKNTSSQLGCDIVGAKVLCRKPSSDGRWSLGPLGHFGIT